MKIKAIKTYFKISAALSACVWSLCASADDYPVPPSTDEITYIGETFQTHDGLTLHGHLAIPTRIPQPRGGFPVVIMYVGSNAFDRYENMPGVVTVDLNPTLLFKSFEESLVSHGIAVFLYDKRGVIPADDSFISNNITSDYQTADANNLALDALSAFDFVSTLSHQINKDKISLLGHSEGTLLAIKTMETVEKREHKIKSLFMLGMLTRSMQENIYTERVEDPLRHFNLLDEDHTGIITQNEFDNFANLAGRDFSLGWGYATWDDFYKANTQLNRQGTISKSEYNYTNQQNFKNFMISVYDNSKPWPSGNYPPRNWFKQYFVEGDFIKIERKFCSKIHVFQGENDLETLFEDVLNLRNICQSQNTPLASFNHYPGEGHGFSPYVGYKSWRETIGPVDPQVVSDVTAQALIDFQ